MDERVFIGVGSNVDAERNIHAAGLLLRERVGLTGISTFYRTAPLNRPEQHQFLNGVFEVWTDLAPRPLKFDVLRNIEAELGRRRTGDTHAPREIDLDLLLYGSRRINEPGLEVPDPDIRYRPFVAVPLRELAPDLILPDGGRLDGLDVLARQSELEADDEFSNSLKERLLHEFGTRRSART